MAVITRIESIGGGRVGGGWGGRWGRVGSRRRAKANIQTQMAVLCRQWVTQPGTTHLVDQVCRQNQFGTSCRLINAPQGPHRP